MPPALFLCSDIFFYLSTHFVNSFLVRNWVMLFPVPFVCGRQTAPTVCRKPFRVVRICQYRRIVYPSARFVQLPVSFGCAHRAGAMHFTFTERAEYKVRSIGVIVCPCFENDSHFSAGLSCCRPPSVTSLMSNHFLSFPKLKIIAYTESMPISFYYNADILAQIKRTFPPKRRDAYKR